MKKITTIALFLLLGLKMQAQISYEGSGNYAKLYDLTYDATVQNKLYAITINNHIVVSLNNGTDWSVLYSHPDTIADLKLTPGNGALSFTAADGLHFFNLSTNQISATYEIPANNVDGANPSYLTGYDVYDEAGTTIILNTSFGVGLDTQSKIFYTNNSGLTWSEIYYTEAYDTVFINEVAISPASPGVLYMSRGFGKLGIIGGLFVSKNGGVTWTEQLPGVILGPIAFKPSAPSEMLIGSFISFGQVPENIYKSTDSGNSWNTLNVPFTAGVLDYITDIKYNPINENKIVVTEDNQILKTEDGGVTWTGVTYEEDDLTYYFGLSATYNPFNENQVVFGTDQYPQVSNDGGTTISQLLAPFYQVTAVSFAQYGSDKHLYYNSQGGYSHINYTTGVNSPFSLLGPNVFTSLKIDSAADPVVAGRLFNLYGGSFTGGTLRVSLDYGVTSTTLLNTFASTIAELAVDPNNSNIAYIVLRSEDNTTLFKVNFTDPTNITSEEIFTPEGTVVEGEAAEKITALLISPDATTLTIAKGITLYKSTDGGVTWTTVVTSGLDLVDGYDLITDLVKNPTNPNNYMIATTVGVYSSSDAGATWTSVLPDARVSKLKYSNVNSDVITAVVYTGLGYNAEVNYTVNGGTTWTNIPSVQINHVYTGSVDFGFTANTIETYFSSSDLGVMKMVTPIEPLGIENPAAGNNGIKIYPNPASAVVNIAVNQNFNLKSAAIYSITGQKVMESSNTAIDISKLSNGIYIVKAELTNGVSVSQKLVKE